MGERETISGSVETVVFRSEDGGYVVFKLNTADEEITVCCRDVAGAFQIEGGMLVECTGSWGFHNTYGPQFEAQKIGVQMPTDTAGILLCLSSKLVPGIGPTLARRIVERFGADSLDVIENSPQRLAEVEGITLSKARRFSKAYQGRIDFSRQVTQLTGLGLSYDRAKKIYDGYGAESVEMLQTDPFALCAGGLLTFDEAESLAQNFELAATPSRCIAGVLYVMQYNFETNGHTCVSRSSLLAPCMELLACNEDDAEIAIDDALAQNLLTSEQIGAREYLFLPEAYREEMLIADKIKLLLRVAPQPETLLASEISVFEETFQIHLDDRQREAIELAVGPGMFILTGGPGTGQTTTVRGIIHILNKKGLKTVLTAPTGRAAKRMSELTGQDAQTIHRLLETQRTDSGEYRFKHDARDPIDADAVIVDEMSMVDIRIFSALLDALPMRCRLIMVGDADQLPPVGAGNVLADLIKSGKIPVVCLQRIFRQAQKSLIVTNAHAIVSGQMPQLDRKAPEDDFFFLQEPSPYLAAKKITDLVTRRLPSAYGDAFKNIQVLCPSRKGETGTETLNQVLQSRLNPKDAKKREIAVRGSILREGDRVIQMKNNYDLPWCGSENTGVFNGEIGTIAALDPVLKTAVVHFDDFSAEYDFEALHELELAYAMTVHKSQGSEFDAVVMPVIAVPPKLAYRNLLYTAVTRAKKLIVLVGTHAQLEKMVQNGKKSKRQSALVHFLSVDKPGVFQ